MPNTEIFNKMKRDILFGVRYLFHCFDLLLEIAMSEKADSTARYCFCVSYDTSYNIFAENA